MIPVSSGFKLLKYQEWRDFMINSVYDYYLTTYAGRQLTKYDTHKKSELRSLYNNIVKISKKSPLYKIPNTESVQRHAIDLKETARSLKNMTDIFDAAADPRQGFRKKKAVSSNEDILDVNYIGEDNRHTDDPGLSIHVQRLATPQINTGEYLSNSACKIAAGNYSFDCSIGGNTYEFQFNVNSGESNQDVQNKLARLFTHSGIGLEANVVTAPSGNTALEIRSQATGVQEFSGEIFHIHANDSEGSAKIVEYFGLQNVSNTPQNAMFTVNGIANSSASNTFTINKEYEISLKNINDLDDDPVSIGFKQDIDTFIDNIKNLADSYNNILSLAEEKSGVSYESSKLFKEIRSLSKRHSNELESSGIQIDEKGYLSLDHALISQVAEEDGLDSMYEKLADFKKDIASRADAISINPMNYVNKTLISYPNPIRSYANPYMTSIYTGMMFNGYV